MLRCCLVVAERVGLVDDGLAERVGLVDDGLAVVDLDNDGLVDDMPAGLLQLTAIKNRTT